MHLSSTVRADNVYSKEDYDAQNLAALTAANNVGFDQIVISDWRYAAALSRTPGGLIGKNKKFADEAALDAYISNCISWYKDIEGVNAVNVGDEPCYDHLESFGQVYQSLGRVWPEAQRFYNFFACGDNEDAIGPIVQREGQLRFDAVKEQYERYLNKAIECMGDIPYIRFDSYPLQPSGISYGYIPTLQIAAKVCKQNGMELHVYLPAMEMYNGSNLTYRKLTVKDVQYLNNMTLGFGASALGCWTYFTPDDANGEYFVDGSSLVTRRCEKTEIYDYYQDRFAKDQDFASVILNFSYRGSRTYSVPNSSIGTKQVSVADNTFVLKAISDVSIDKECAVVTELYDTAKRNYMYMIMNAVDPQVKGSKAYQTTTVTFEDKYTHVLIYKNAINEPYSVKLNKHKLEIEQTAGEAVFVIPY